jgi:hypothetical protein
MTKNLLVSLAIGLISIMFGGCQSREEASEMSSKKTAEASVNSKEAGGDSRAEFQEALHEFVRETNSGVTENERRIAGLRKQVTGIDARYHAGYYDQLDKLERRNKEIGERVKNFEDSDEEERWVKFREDVKRDLADLTSDLEEFAIDNE